MKSFWFRELKRYPIEEIRLKFGRYSQQVIEKLIAANILRQVKSGHGDPNIEDMLELASDGEPMLTFNFCGIILIDDFVIRCYPKYISGTQYAKAFPLVLRAIQCYEKSHRQKLSIAQRGDFAGNMFSIIMAILEDYIHNGLYRSTRKEYEINGEGETDWQRTIEKFNPVFVGKNFVYVDCETLRNRTDNENFFRQLHMAILEECSRIIYAMDLSEIIPVKGIRFPKVRLNVLGTRKYILRRLKQEYSRQFLEQRRSILRLLIIYMEKQSSHKTHAPIVFFGTNAMNLVWEKALADVLNNQLREKVKNITFLDNDLKEKYEFKECSLIEIIERPQWNIDISKNVVKTDTLEPDIISIDEHGFTIYDAKYYFPRVSSSGIVGQPGLESVTKQYLYHMAYQKFLSYFKVKNVKNVFLIPHEPFEGSVMTQKIGTVIFDILSRQTGVDIETYYVDADVVWKAYVNHKIISLPISL